VSDPGVFLKELVATDPCFEDYEIDSQLRQVIVSRFSDVLGKSGIPMLDLVGNYEQLGKFVLEIIKPEFAGWGLDLVKFYIENLSLPPAVEEAIDKRSAMGAVGDLSKYTQFQVAEAIRIAAANPSGGAAGAGVGLGAGLGIAQAMQQAMGVGAAAPAAGAGGPPPLPGAPAFHVAIDGKPVGPLVMDALRQQAAVGNLTRETLVWREGMAAWAKAGDVAELAAVFTSAPPPLPK
jgi:hypothetical protein